MREGSDSFKVFQNNGTDGFDLRLEANQGNGTGETLSFDFMIYDPLNQWKLVADKKNHVYVVRNRGEEICYFDYRKSDMNTGKSDNNLTITGSSGRNITGKWVKTNCK